MTGVLSAVAETRPAGETRTGGGRAVVPVTMAARA